MRALHKITCHNYRHIYKYPNLSLQHYRLCHQSRDCTHATVLLSRSTFWTGSFSAHLVGDKASSVGRGGGSRSTGENAIALGVVGLKGTRVGVDRGLVDVVCADLLLRSGSLIESDDVIYSLFFRPGVVCLGEVLVVLGEGVFRSRALPGTGVVASF